MIDLELPDDDTETIVVCSGGGSRGFWQWLVLLMVATRFKVSRICGTSAGALNSYGFGKGLQQYVTDIYQRVFAGETDLITLPGLGELKNGKLSFNEANIVKFLLKGINVWDAPKFFTGKGRRKLIKQVLDNFLAAPALLDNKPLYDRITEMQNMKRGWDVPAYWNRVNLRNGQLEEDGWDSAQTLERERDSVVSSSTIPLLWPLVNGVYGDGGLREGTPLDQVFRSLNPEKKYRIIVIECSTDQMPDNTTLDNPIHVFSQVISIFMNESRRNDYKGVIDKNEEAKEKGEALGRRYVPIYKIVCSAGKDSLDFSPEAGTEFRIAAKKDFEEFLQKYEEGLAV